MTKDDGGRKPSTIALMSHDDRLRQLDLLRGIAILLVIVCHTVQFVPSPSKSLDFIAQLGRFGVQLFFVVSGYTMVMMWELRRGEARPVFRFYVRRFMRIAPAFWLAIPIYVALNDTGATFFAPQGVGPLEIALTTTFLHGLWPSAINSVVPGGWSIADEMLFYVAFPLFNRWFRGSTACVAAAVAVFAMNVFAVLPALQRLPGITYLNDQFSMLFIFTQLPAFLLGMATYWAVQRGSVTRHLLFALATFLACAGIATCLGQGKFAAIAGITALESTIAFVAIRRSWRWAYVEAIGRRSYVMYLAHFVLLISLRPLLPTNNWLSVAFAFGLTVAGAYAASQIFEQTIERQSKRLVGAVIS